MVMPVLTEDEEFSFPSYFFNEKSVLIHLLLFPKKFFSIFPPLFLWVLESCAIGPRLKKSLFIILSSGYIPLHGTQKKGKEKKFVFFFSRLLLLYSYRQMAAWFVQEQRRERQRRWRVDRPSSKCLRDPSIHTFTLFSSPFFLYIYT